MGWLLKGRWSPSTSGPFRAYAAGARGAGSREQYLVTMMNVQKKFVVAVPVRSVEEEVVEKAMLVVLQCVRSVYGDPD